MRPRPVGFREGVTLVGRAGHLTAHVAARHLVDPTALGWLFMAESYPRDLCSLNVRSAACSSTSGPSPCGPFAASPTQELGRPRDDSFPKASVVGSRSLHLQLSLSRVPPPAVLPVQATSIPCRTDRLPRGGETCRSARRRARCDRFVRQGHLQCSRLWYPWRCRRRRGLVHLPLRQPAAIWAACGVIEIEIE